MTTIQCDASPTRIWDGGELPIETVQTAAAELGWGEVRPAGTGPGCWFVEIPDTEVDDLLDCEEWEAEAEIAGVMLFGYSDTSR